jgi:hypothetical protein
MSRPVLRAALRAFPADRRERDGAVLLGAAEDLAEGGAPVAREAASLVIAGLHVRAVRLVPRGLRGAPWRAALVRLALPLAVVNATVWSTAIARWPSPPQLGAWWTVVLAGSTLALTGTASSRRGPALAGAGAVAAAVVAGQLLHRGGQVGTPVGPGWVDIDAAAVPLVLLLVAAACVPPRPARPATGLRRLAWAALLPAAGYAAARALPIGTLDPALAALPAGAAGLAFAVGLLRLRRDPAGAVAGALALAAIAPGAVWTVLGLLGTATDEPLANLATLSVAAAVAAVIVLAPIRRVARRSP